MQSQEPALPMPGLVKPPPDAVELLPQLVSVAPGAPTMDVLVEEHDQKRALALALAAPEFQRR